MALAGAMAWLLLRGVLEIGAALVLLWLAVAWGLIQSLRIRLLAMLHLGFLWLGLALLLGGLSHLLAAFIGQAVLPLAPLHALTMGCLGSLMLAMVTRVWCRRGPDGPWLRTTWFGDYFGCCRRQCCCAFLRLCAGPGRRHCWLRPHRFGPRS